MVVLKYLVVVAALLAVNAARAFTDVCTLANTDTSRVQATPEEIAAYKAKMSNECALSEKYQQMVLKARQRYGISLEQISQYQALRYVERWHYEAAKNSNTPVPLIYQIFQTDYAKPLERRSSAIWDGFQMGIRQLESERARVAQGESFGVPEMLRVHTGFYQVSDEIGDFAHEPFPGKLKPPYGNDRHWWKLAPEKVESTKKLADDINEFYSNLGLIGSQLDRLYGDAYKNDVISVRQSKDGDGMAIYGGDSSTNEERLNNLYHMVNTLLGQARQGQHMVWKGHLFTPGQLAFTTQQFFVQTHPMSEGNGRVSRFQQELILTLFSMPHGSSGDLMDDDVVTLNGPYYSNALIKTHDLLMAVDDCLERVYPEATKPKMPGSKIEGRGSKHESPKPAPPPISILAVDQTTIDYGCRILK